MNRKVFVEHLEALSYRYPLDVDEQLRHFVVRAFDLPPGYNRKTTDIWATAPEDYPESPLGVGSARLYLPVGLRFQGRIPEDYHEGWGPRGWAWWCYQWIDWRAGRDDLITFFEVVRAHMTNPL